MTKWQELEKNRSERSLARIRLGELWGLDFFAPWEFDYPEKMDIPFLKLLDEARKTAHIPFRITSSWRKGGVHETGKAVGISCTIGTEREIIVKALWCVGFRRIGIYDLHVHVDADESRAQDVLWWGVST